MGGIVDIQTTSALLSVVSIVPNGKSGHHVSGCYMAQQVVMIRGPTAGSNIELDVHYGRKFSRFRLRPWQQAIAVAAMGGRIDLFWS